MTPLERISERVMRLGHPDDPKTPRPLLTLSEFFDGNSHVGSICCNLDPLPTPAEVYTLLKGIAARPDVADIRVVITQFDEPEWPFSDTVYVMTTATPEEVASWFDETLRPDDFCEGFGGTYEPYMPPPGFRPVALWWD